MSHGNTADDASQDESTLEALASLPTFYHPTASPDGERIAYYYDGTGRNELYVQDVATGDRTRVSDGNVPKDARYPFVWHPDGDRLFMHVDDDGDEQNDVHLITLDGETETVVENDGQSLLFDVGDGGTTLVYATTTSGQMNVHRYDADAEEASQLTDHDQPAWQARLSPDGDRIAYVANEREDLENQDVYVMAADGSEKRRLDVGDVGCEASVAGWHPDGDRLLVGDDSANVDRVGLYDLETDSVTWYGAGEYEERPQYVLPDGDRLLAVRVRECAKVPVVYDTADPSSGRELDLPEGAATLPDGPQANGVLADGRVLVTNQTSTTRQTVYAYDLDADEAEVVVEPDYGEFDPEDFVDAEVVTYESTDGLEIEALVYDSGERPSPGMVLVHGGPHVSETKRFDARKQFLLDEGYSLIVPNYRGSTGRGREFKNRIHGDWGGMEQEDVREAGRWLKERDWIDADRVGVYGGSYGGYSTYMQLVENPDFWTAGGAWVGMTDLLSLYEESMPHFKTTLEEQLGDPEENAEFYRERSAITHVDALSAPLLMVHGVNDPRCPVSQARDFRAALEDRGLEEGVDFEYEELGEQGHGSTDVDDKIRSFRLLADFLDRRL